MQAGDLVGGQYQLIRSMQSSWLACDRLSGQSCLLKPVASFADPRAVELLQVIWHVGLPRLLGQICCGPAAGDTDGQGDYFVFEFRPGQSLRERAAGCGGRLPASEVLPLFRQTACILAYLHNLEEQPLIHLDIKPEHLIMGPDGQISLVDFGAARFFRHPDLCLDNLRKENAPQILTPEYAAPEHIAGSPCPGSDIYALGLCMLQLLSGRKTTQCRQRPVHDLLPEAMPALQGLIGSCLHADPALRVSDARLLADRLENLIDSEVPQHCEATSCRSVAPVLPIDSAALVSPPEPAVVMQPEPAMAAFPNVPQQPVKPAAPAASADPLSARQVLAPLICVWGHAEFGCELAAVLADELPAEQDMLVIDADLLDPQADLLLGCDPGPAIRAAAGHPAGLDLALAEEQRGHLDVRRVIELAQATRIRRLKLLSTRADLDHYDYFSLDSFEQLVRLSRMSTGLVLVLCSRFVFDAFTCLTLMAANRVFVARTGNSASFRTCARSLRLLVSRYQLDMSKVDFVAFDYHPDDDLSRGTLDELCGQRLAGCISATTRRRMMKCGAVPYAVSLDRINQKEYKAIIKQLLPALAAQKVEV